jgi:hypothetical protein
MKDGYEIVRHQPGNKVYWKVYLNDVFQQTFDRKKDAEEWIGRR